MKILFSPIGMTDPISGKFDGPLLHICRNCNVEKVYLYTSKEVCEREERDNRYTLCLKWLSDLSNKHISVEFIRRADLKEVHLFDNFLDDFKNILEDIHLNSPDAEILLNVSSGTPAMQSALYFISALEEFKVLPIQVRTPADRSNIKEERTDIYDVAEHWKNNKDNLQNTPDRCKEINTQGIVNELRCEKIKKLIDSNNYSAARFLAKSIPNADFAAAINGACARLDLNVSYAAKKLSVCGKKLIEEYENEEDTRAVEYALMLSVKVENEQYADFIRAISPIFMLLLKRILRCKCGINIDNYTFRGKWSADKLKGTDIETLLKGKTTDYVYSSHLVSLIEHCAVKDIAQRVRNLRTVEEKVRNIAAHEICSIDRSVMQKEGVSPQNIIEAIRALFADANINVSEDVWNSYKAMNTELKKLLK